MEKGAVLGSWGSARSLNTLLYNYIQIPGSYIT